MPNPPAPRRFIYNDRALRFQDAQSKRFVSESTLRSEFDAFEKAVASRIGELTRSLYAGNIRVSKWQNQVADLVRTLHVAGAALGAGGWNRMTPSVRGRVGQRLRFQYEHLEEFAKAIAKERISEQAAIARGDMYANAGYGSWQEEKRAQAIASGFRFERSVLSPAEHCELCIQEANKGWSRIGTLIPIMKRTCLSNDRCRWEFK